MNKNDLIKLMKMKNVKALSETPFNSRALHRVLDELLLDYINDKQVSEEFYLADKEYY